MVFSDGEDHLNRWKSRLEELHNEGIVVHAVAIGDADQGHPVPAGKKSEPLVYRGQPVLSRRTDLALRRSRRQTGGSFVRLGVAAGDLGSLYQTRIEPAARQRRDSTRPAERAERFPLFLVAGLTSLIAASWPARRRWGWSWAWDWRWSRHRPLRKPIAATLLVVAVGLATGAGDIPVQTAPGTAAEAVAKGQAAYAQGRWQEALAAFETAITRAPASAVPRYNAAAALFQLGRYDVARERYAEARERGPGLANEDRLWPGQRGARGG